MLIDDDLTNNEQNLLYSEKTTTQSMVDNMDDKIQPQLIEFSETTTLTPMTDTVIDKREENNKV